MRLKEKRAKLPKEKQQIQPKKEKKRKKKKEQGFRRRNIKYNQDQCGWDSWEHLIAEERLNRKTNLRIADDFRKQKGSLFTDLSKSWCIHLYRNQEQKTMAIYLSFLCTVYIVLRCSVKRRKKSTTYDMSIPQQV